MELRARRVLVDPQQRRAPRPVAAVVHARGAERRLARRDRGTWPPRPCEAPLLAARPRRLSTSPSRRATLATERSSGSAFPMTCAPGASSVTRGRPLVDGDEGALPVGDEEVEGVVGAGRQLGEALGRPAGAGRRASASSTRRPRERRLRVGRRGSAGWSSAAKTPSRFRPEPGAAGAAGPAARASAAPSRCSSSAGPAAGRSRYSSRFAATTRRTPGVGRWRSDQRAHREGGGSGTMRLSPRRDGEL